MAYTSVDRRTGKVRVRAYAGINPATGRPHEVTETLPPDATEDQVAQAAARVDARAQVSKGNTAAMTVGSAVAWWFESYQLSGVSPATVKSYASKINRHVMPRIGQVPLDQATPAVFTRFFTDLRRPKPEGAGLSQVSVKNIASMLHGCFATLRANGIVDVNPLAEVTVKPGASPEAKPLMPRDFAILTAYLETVLSGGVTLATYEEHRQAAMWWTALYTGLRRGELAGLDVGDFRRGTSGHEVRVARTVVHDVHGNLVIKPPKSKASRRVVILDDDTADVISAHLTVQEQVLAANGVKLDLDTPMFADQDGGRYDPDAVSRAFSALAARLGLAEGVHLHTLRHTHATYLLEAGVPVLTVKERLGHANVSMTLNTYGHVLPGRDAEAATAFRDFGRRSHGTNR